MVCLDCGAKIRKRMYKNAESGDEWIVFECGSSFLGIPHSEGETHSHYGRCPTHGEPVVAINLFRPVCRVSKGDCHALIAVNGTVDSFRYGCGCVFSSIHDSSLDKFPLIEATESGFAKDNPVWTWDHFPTKEDNCEQ